MPENYQRFVLATLAYSAVFQYPLTASETWHYLICTDLKKIDYEQFLKTINLLVSSGKIYCDKNYYSLQKNDFWVVNRLKQEKIAKRKIIIAQETAKLLALLPTVEFIGLSGKLAMGIAEADDDIDLFIITKSQTIWLTRLICLTILFVIGRKRSPGSGQTADKICLNMWLDRDHLQIPTNERDLFCAHEIAQMKILFQRNNCYQNFLSSNSWFRNSLPNAFLNIIKLIKLPVISNKRKNRFLSILEIISGAIQLWYMKNKKTSEVIAPGYLRFHPKDARGWILAEYKKLTR